jgi:pimeloyl-ACP methyl ester carboxylesterase
VQLSGCVAVLVLVSTLACADSGRPLGGQAPLSLTPCHVARLAEEVLCGTHEVFEDRDARAGRTLSIQVAVMPPLRRTAEPDPLFILAGGPGQGARGFAPAAARYFKKIRRTRPIVLVDLRGTGASGKLDCPRSDDEISFVAGFFFDPGEVPRCASTLAADPRRYTHAEALADLDDIRKRLGYPHINLWGGSWGTRAALLYATTYPESVRTVVLDGAVPLSMEFPRTVAATAERAFERLLEGCRTDASCAAAHRTTAAEFRELLTRLESRQGVQIRHPRTGTARRVALSRGAVAEIVRVALYSPGDAARLLQVIRHAIDGDFGPLLAQAVRSAAWSTDDMALGQTMAILCSEDLPMVAGADFARDAAGTFSGTGYADLWRQRCSGWPAGKGITIDRQATSTIPALILSGEHDPVTPAPAGDAMGRHFPNHHHIVVPGAAHNASFSGCVPDLIAAFIARGSVEGLDGSCAARVPWPPAVVSDAGTLP